MTRSVLVALLLLVALPLTLPAASASHVVCTSRDPFPPAPVGGVVGQTYTFATDTTYGAFLFGFGLACRTLDQGIHAVNAQCVFLIGRPCLP